MGMPAPHAPFERATHALRLLFTSSLSLRMAALSFSLLFGADRIFALWIFPHYAAFLEHWDPNWANIDTIFAPIVWLSYVTMLLGSLTVVITFAATSTPKLIDLYMEDRRSLMLVWWSLGCMAHALTIKLYPELGLSHPASIVFNYHFLLPSFVFVSFPFILLSLRSTKTANVIDSLFRNMDEILDRLVRQGPDKKLSPRSVQSQQVQLFETLNQLMDLLIYVPYKEPKAMIIEGMGRLIIRYVQLKAHFPRDFFLISQKARNDISFRTMQGLLDELEEKQIFLEQKSLRLIGNAYITFLEEGQFDLSTLCAEQINYIGKEVVAQGDEVLIDVITVRLNTHFRFALKHAQAHNEPRNLYNLVFHYGQFASHLVAHDHQEGLKTCFRHFGFYALQCFNASPQAMALAFILDTLAVEMQKLLMALYERQWDRPTQEELLQQFLMLDNFQNVDHQFAKNFFSKNVGVRLLHIGLALYYLEQGEEAWAEGIAEDTLQDWDLMGEELFHKTMGMIFMRLKFSGPTFWEDTDRGNLNIYYTPYVQHLETFQALQKKYIGERIQQAELV